MKRNNRQVGSKAEGLACTYLKGLNYTIMARNFSCRSGEIDIIALDKDCIVFVEVKYRKNNNYGRPRESVNYYKQRNMTKAASYYLLINDSYHKNSRFDVVEIMGDTIELIQNAFNPVY